MKLSFDINRKIKYEDGHYIIPAKTEEGEEINLLLVEEDVNKFLELAILVSTPEGDKDIQ